VNHSTDREIRVAHFKIVRENSQYNRYIKWFYKEFNEDLVEIASIGCKTERQARLLALDRDFDIGNHRLRLLYKEIK
jgi:hypothetical protein